MKKDIIYREDAIEAIRRLPNAGIHWYVSAEAVFEALFELPSAQTETSILTVTVAPDSEEIERVVRKIKDAPVMELPSAQSEWEHRTTRRVVKNSGSTNWYECLRCGTAVDLMDKFCRGCGRKFEEER